MMKALKNARWQDEEWGSVLKDSRSPWSVEVEELSRKDLWAVDIWNRRMIGYLQCTVIAPSLRMAKAKARAIFDARDEAKA